MDSGRIKIARLTDFHLALMILQDEVISGEIYEDGSSLVVPDLVGEYWLSAFIDDDLMGCYRVHGMGAVLWQIHARIYPQFRQKWAIKTTKAAFVWCVKNIPNLEKIMCFVPSAHKNVDLHAIQVGMSRVGTLENSYLKDKRLIGQAIFEIDRAKIETFGGGLCQQ